MAARRADARKWQQKTLIDKGNSGAYGAQTLVITGAPYREFLHGKQAYPLIAPTRESIASRPIAATHASAPRSAESFHLVEITLDPTLSIW
ncbi:MAG: hypothetical protein WAN59_06425, partial [Candidatus Baltobacteraceae bacterium]